jgi:Dolichyl-phosphate-mannose-protein mannosyltransferase
MYYFYGIRPSGNKIFIFSTSMYGLNMKSTIKDFKDGVCARKPVHRIIFQAIAATGLLMGLGIFASSFLPFDHVRPLVDSYSADGSVEFFSREFYRAMTFRLRVCGIFLVLVCVVALLLNRCMPDQSSRFSVVFQDVTEWKQVFTNELRQLSMVTLVAVIIILAAGLAVRLAFIQEPIRYDEAFTYLNFASRSPLVTLTYYLVPNNHIFHSLMVLLATSLFGSAEWAIRLPALTSGILLIPAMFLLGQKISGYRTGLWAAALIAVSSYLVEYSVNGRGYTMICLFTVLLMVATRSVRKNPRSAGSWGAFVLFAVFGLVTVPTMLYSLCLASAWYLLGADIAGAQVRESSIRPLILAWVVIALGTLLFYTPSILVSGAQALFANKNILPMSLKQWVLSMPELFISLAGLYHRDLPIYLITLLAAGFFLGVFRTPRLVMAAISVLLLLFLQRVVPYERVFLFLLPVYLAVAAVGISSSIDRLVRGFRPTLKEKISVFLTIAWLLGAGFFVLREQGPSLSEETGYFPEARETAEYIASNLGFNEKILAVSPSNTPLRYYCALLGVNAKRFSDRKSEELVPNGVFLVVNLRYESMEELAANFGLTVPLNQPLPPVFLFQEAAVYYFSQTLIESSY